MDSIADFLIELLQDFMDHDRLMFLGLVAGSIGVPFLALHAWMRKHTLDLIEGEAGTGRTLEPARRSLDEVRRECDAPARFAPEVTLARIDHATGRNARACADCSGKTPTMSRHCGWQESARSTPAAAGRPSRSGNVPKTRGMTRHRGARHGSRSGTILAKPRPLPDGREMHVKSRICFPTLRPVSRMAWRRLPPRAISLP